MLSTKSKSLLKIEILSSFYGYFDVTDKVRRYFTTHVNPSTKTRSFTPNNIFFGRDPMYGQRKTFMLVWRRRYITENRASYTYSVTRTIRAFENELVVLDYDTELPIAEPMPFSHNSAVILDATYHSTDVTAIVVRLSGDPFKVTNGLFGSDPAYGTFKRLIVTYGYGDLDSMLNCYTLITQEGAEHYIAPPLTIHAANWATDNITDILRAQITSEQTLHVDTVAMSFPDPWHGVSKAVAILYQYGDGPLQLVVAHEGSGVLTVEPRGPARRAFLNPLTQSRGRPIILAAVWGLLPIEKSQFGLMAETEEIPCTNEWFGFDGRPNTKKTCHVFVQSPRTGRIQSVVAIEGQKLKIPAE